MKELKQLLTEAERAELETCEEAVRKGLSIFIEVGRALVTIRDKKLYRGTDKTFEDYCANRWGFQRLYAYRLMKAAVVMDNLFPIGNKTKLLPTCEAQVRPLFDLEPEQAQAAWEKAVNQAESKHQAVTAKLVADAAAEYHPPKRSRTPPIHSPETPPKPEAPEPAKLQQRAEPMPEVESQTEEPACSCEGMVYAKAAIAILAKISYTDQERTVAGHEVVRWVREHILIAR